MRDVILEAFKEAYANAHDGAQPPEIDDGSVLLETGLDSLGFAILIVELEEKLGFDPFTLSDEPYYPNTFGELVAYYQENQPK